MTQISWQTLAFGAILSICAPIVARVFTSPLGLLLISPFIGFAVLAFIFFSNVLLAWVLGYLPRSMQPAQLRLAARPLALSTPAAWQAVLTRHKWSATQGPGKHPPLYPSSLPMSKLLDDIVSVIIRDFVLSWYSNISPSPSFPAVLDETIYFCLKEIIRRVEALDLATFVVHRVLPKITTHVEKFRQSEMALRGVGIERHLTQTDELDLLLASRYAGKEGKLHPAVDNLSTTVTRHTEQAHLRNLVEKVLPFIMPEKEIKSKAVAIVAREILACVVLSAVTEMFADPDFWNGAIDQAAGAAIRQQKLISKVRGILEVQSTAPTNVHRGPSIAALRRANNSTAKSTARQYEYFIQSVNKCDSLLDARRLKNDIVGEIRRTRILLANHENEELIDGEKASDVVAYLDRLYNAKRHVESRIILLGGAEDDSRQSILQVPSSSQHLTLRDVLSNPNLLSYFMEFMDRRNKSMQVQFWLTVESFKNPLETVDSDDEDEPVDDEDVLEVPNLPSVSATIRGDMTMIDNLYFSNPGSLSRLPAISQKHIDAVQAYVADTTAAPSATKEKKVRNSVLLAQREVERAMEEEFQEFERSDLWFKVLADSEVGKKRDSVLLPHPPESSLTPPSPSAIRPSDSRTRSGTRPTFLVPSKQPPRPSSMPFQSSASSPFVTTPTSPTDTSVATLESSQGGRDTLKGPSTNKLAFLISPGAEAPRAPLFDDEDPESEDAVVQQETIDALQAALTDIIANENESLRGPRRLGGGSREHSFSQASSVADVRHSQDLEPGHERRGSRLFDDEEEHEETVSMDDHPRGSIQIAAPGDLHLAGEIERLTEKIGKLQAQETILDALIRKAELTGDAQELKILRRSKASMERELRELTFQRSQYERQEAENRLVPERTRISISSSGVSEAAGKQVVRYFVEVQQLAPDGSFASGWIVARRYNEFWNMHQRLREKFATVRNLEFPPKKLVTSLSNSFVDTRRIGLERYMQGLVKIPLVCESDELRSFLSRTSTFPLVPEPSRSSASLSGLLPTHGVVRSVYRSVAESIDDMFFGPSMLDVMIERLSKQAAEFAGIVGSGVHDEDLIEQALKAKSTSQSGAAGRVVPPEETLLRLSSGDLKPLEGESGLSSFTAPICDLILAVFELNKKNNWLRKQAVVIILQQVLGGTIERKSKEMAKSYLDEAHLLQYISAFKDALWPGGELKPPGQPRTSEEKLRTREEANRKLSTLMPDLAANMIGRSNARRGARRIFSVLQNRRLNQHIIYSVIDEVFAALFPEANIL